MLLLYTSVALAVAAASGTFTENTYNNDQFSISIDIPESWEVTTTGIGEKTATRAAQLIPEAEEELKKIRPHLEYEFKASRKSEEQPGRPWLQLTACIHHGGATTRRSTSREYLNNYLRDISKQSLKVAVVEPAQTVLLNEHEFERIRYFVSGPSYGIYQSAYFRVVDNDVLIIIGFFATEEHLRILEDILDEKVL